MLSDSFVNSLGTNAWVLMKKKKSAIIRCYLDFYLASHQIVLNHK